MFVTWKPKFGLFNRLKNSAQHCSLIYLSGCPGSTAFGDGQSGPGLKSGRCCVVVLVPVPALSDWSRTLKGVPFWAVKMPLISHPESRKRVAAMPECNEGKS